MNSTLQRWSLTACVAVLLVAGFSPARAGVSDAWISSKVKMLLINSPSVGGLPINVDTDEGRVTLHGKVHSRAEKAEAARIAGAGTGVLSVRNLLQVVPASQRKQADVADDRLTEDVKAALKAEPALESSSIHAKSVHQGVVLLSGKAATLSAHLLALEVASFVPGVRRVASEIESPDEFADREIWFEEPASDAARANAVTDGWITARTKLLLMTDGDFPAGDINVDTHRGVVTLFGTAHNAAAADKAVRLAQEVVGTRSVNNELRVVGSAQKKRVTAKDDQLESAVRHRIEEAKLQGADIHVQVKAATARLTGTVETASHRYTAISIAYSTPGVARVENDLRIEGPKTSQR